MGEQSGLIILLLQTWKGLYSTTAKVLLCFFAPSMITKHEPAH